ncbi:synaptotagmin-9 [Athene cunicularia]|uniref:synaptotagmin-9 n=2 Tax=Telluraves TaxID=3073808 RepID=UPI000EF6EB3E|nr:synaptotagmin-9 [Athene cunicularia]
MDAQQSLSAAEYGDTALQLSVPLSFCKCLFVVSVGAFHVGSTPPVPQESRCKMHREAPCNFRNLQTDAKLMNSIKLRSALEPRNAEALLFWLQNLIFVALDAEVSTSHTSCPGGAELQGAQRCDLRVFVLFADISISLLSLVVTACGLALFGVSLFVSWKLCWIPWRERGLPFGSKDNKQESLNYTDTETNDHDYSEDYLGQPTAYPESSMKISHTSPDIPLDAQAGTKENCVHNVRMHRQITEPTSSARHNSIRRQLNLSNPDFNIQQVQKQEQLTGIGRIKPELYKQRSVDTDDGRRSNSKACGKLNFILKYDCDLEQLIVKIHKAINLPAKDFSGTSDPYVKIYLLPDRKTKHQTKVHRKTLNPVFDEVFLFTVPYNDLNTRKLHFSVYDFDRFSRHDLIGQVIVDNFLDLADFPRECNIWKDIEYVTNDNVDLGDLMFSLCYLPTAGRLTITIIKARNLKAMDITGASDPYVKVSLMCEGRRLKKRKTSTKRNTLNPVYNEAIVFDVPPENIDQINLSIAVMDYDRVGHNEVIGVCQVGNDAESLGRDHWNEMLSYPRKPIAHWHPLAEGPIQQKCYAGLLRLDGCRRGFLTLLTYSAEIWHSC